MSLKYFPVAHDKHTGSTAVVQVCAVQPAIGVHAVHVRSAVGEHAVSSNRPGSQALEHATHALSLKYVPSTQLRHTESLAVVHVAALHPAIAVQAPQTRSAVAVHAALSYCPASHAPEHVVQVLALPLRYEPTSHAAHTESLSLVHLTSIHPAIGAQLAHVRSLVAVHAPLTYWPASHAVEHA